jgi:hypothetical protein
MGFFGTYILAIVTTLLVGPSVLLLTGPSRRAEWRCRTQSNCFIGVRERIPR